MRTMMVAVAAAGLFAENGRAADDAKKAGGKKTGAKGLTISTRFNPKELTVDKKTVAGGAMVPRVGPETLNKTPVRELGVGGTVKGSIIAVDEKARSFDVKAKKDIVRVRVKGSLEYHGTQAPHEIDEIQFTFRRIDAWKGSDVLVINEAEKTILFKGLD